VVAWIGFGCCLMAGFVLGLFLAVPVAIGFSIFLAVISPEPQAYVTRNAASVIGLPAFPAGPIYITIHGKQEGPYNHDQLQGFWSAGTLHPGSFYWQEGMAEWRPVRSLVEKS